MRPGEKTLSGHDGCTLTEECCLRAGHRYRCAEPFPDGPQHLSSCTLGPDHLGRCPTERRG